MKDFEVGDYVVRVEPSGYWDDRYGKVGEVYVVTKILDGFHIKIMNPATDQVYKWGCSKKAFELVSSPTLIPEPNDDDLI